jgi:hypothetical protein
MRGSKDDLPVAVDVPQGTVRQAEWGGMMVERGTFRQQVDAAPLYAGLPDDRCQCPHWGYVIAGELHFRYADREEVYRAGDAYYVPPGHTTVIGAGCEYVEFSPADGYRETAAAAERNLAVMRGA